MKGTRIILIILGIIMIVTGIYCLLSPALTALTLGYIVGINMIIDAVGGIILWSDRRKAGISDGWALVGAILSLVFGFILTGSAAMQLALDMAIVYIAAVWMVAMGIIRIVFAIRLRKVSDALDAELLGRNWGLILITGILLVVCGLFGFANPAGMIIAIGINLGLNVIIAGADLIAIAL